MKKIYYLILAISIIILKPVSTNAVSLDIEYLDILIGKAKLEEKLEFKSENGFEISENLENLNSKIIRSNNIFLSFLDEEYIEIQDDEGNILEEFSKDEKIFIKGEFNGESIIQFEKSKYRDIISFIIKDDEILIINNVKLHNYLYGVLPREVGSSFSYEALKAQAIASKNYAFSNINKHKNDGFHLCNSTHCQVYGGYDGEHDTINRAIDETIDIFLTYNGDLISTPYHSNSGGYTENSEDVWGGMSPYLRSVKDDFSLNTPSSTWDMEITPLEIKNKLLAAGIDVGDVLDMDIIEKTPAGRISKLKIKGSKKEEIITGDKLRSIMGNTLFKSTAFEIIKSGKASANYVYAVSADSKTPLKVDLNNSYILKDILPNLSNRNAKKRMVSPNTSRDFLETAPKPLSFKFTGKGYGHGVGMSQWGANEMAKKGYDYKEILSHYYTNIDFTYINKN